MGLNPGENRKAEALRQKILDDNFNDGSPYYGMFWCGYYGVNIDDCIAKCSRNGIALREKDIRSYQDGQFKRGTKGNINLQGLTIREAQAGIAFKDMKLADFPMIPPSWIPPTRRFFPCTEDNRPMQKWGWTRDFSPTLYTMREAIELSPCGWVGQNMLYQRFIVMDIDGRGHGQDDEEVIAFGNSLRSSTLTLEDPAKPGSFHLYFTTDRLIPVRHFPWAKLDLMGNAVNAAVYFKNKQANGLPMRMLDEEVWQLMIQYQQRRKEN